MSACPINIATFCNGIPLIMRFVHNVRLNLCGWACYTDDDVNFNNIGAVKIDTNGDITIYFPTVYSTCVYTSIVYDID